MIIFPAIDLRAGRVVRLRQGRAGDETVYGDDPAAVAQRWEREGAEWLHVVNLDGAFGESGATNLRELAQIIGAISIPVQFGGGLRDAASIEQALTCGVARIVVGTAALQNPPLVSEAVARWGAERIAVGIDARKGMVSTHGWQRSSEVSALELARRMKARGIRRIIHTDIARDGMLRGIDAGAIAALVRACGLNVIASGGVASLSDVQALAAQPEIEGVIIGQALYTGALSLGEAIHAGQAHHPLS